MSVIRSVVAGCGAYLPKQVVTNADLARKIETSDEWIRQRTGIGQRHVAAEGELTSHLAIKASEAALKDAGIKADELDLIVLATTTPDETFPATATRVQAALGMTRGMAFDVQAVCSGFVYALAVADNFLRVGQAKTALVIGAETFTRLLDWNDRGTSVLFGDGAGAVVLKAAPGKGDKSDRGILSTHLFSDGRYHDMLYVDGGPSSTGTTGVVRMEGREVFRHAVTKLAQAVDEAIASNGVSEAEIDWLVPHQANRRIIDSMGQRLKLAPEKVVVTIDRHANTSAASIPLALAEAHADGRIKRGQLVLIEAMGGGFTWGSALIRW
ncbi:3-oxoacyl-[acyl-carrier-protein] synthase 3 [Hypericibacter terrae]|uniref:Beta-ketoacyl-[acyl-carrier-protein] synthase III n=1 Tax=Hypericibacter terrae TaxID=2602015 RepID=A0A5J6MKI0_9PROT|nr:beta-ketoacyl-ACP synthase III [Hypericibacter terrae]QEX16780.1 3-oxoacyl-[acyl-carrier-protein] synthase 3 [Hypericibacter terrae]